MPTTSDISLKDIAAAIANELQLDSAECLSVTQVTVSVTYSIDRSSGQTDWMDEWYQEFKQKEIIPF